MIRLYHKTHSQKYPFLHLSATHKKSQPPSSFFLAGCWFITIISGFRPPPIDGDRSLIVGPVVDENHVINICHIMWLLAHTAAVNICSSCRASWWERGPRPLLGKNGSLWLIKGGHAERAGCNNNILHTHTLLWPTRRRASQNLQQNSFHREETNPANWW